MEDSVYDFTEAEKKFFQDQITKINTLMAAMQNAANLVVSQQELPGGPWQIKQDGTGLIKVNAAAEPSAPQA
jgi:hypothetical protein